ncbi:MAG: helix-turn-helix domain-containing protein [Thiothrix sp.]
MNEFKFHIEAEFLLSVLEDCEGNLSKAANQLGISRETLSRKIEYKKFQQSLKNKWNGKKP